jgi:pyridoxine 5-phosphate synthase
VRLGVNIDHVATLRQLRAGLVDYPDVIEAAKTVVRAGADQITIHLRGDRRHIQEQDLFAIAKARPAPLNLEIAATEEMTEIALKAKPDIVCLVPEKREEITTEGGLNVVKFKSAVGKCIQRLHQGGIRVSLFIEAEDHQIKASGELKADAVEFHTGQYALARGSESQIKLKGLKESFVLAHQLGLAVHAGHGLDYKNVTQLIGAPHLEELNIGHSIVCRAVVTGLDRAVREMKEILSGKP